MTAENATQFGHGYLGPAPPGSLHQRGAPRRHRGDEHHEDRRGALAHVLLRRTPVDKEIVLAGHEPNGYFWDGVTTFLRPDLAERLDLDSEGGMFSHPGRGGTWSNSASRSRPCSRIRPPYELSSNELKSKASSSKTDHNPMRVGSRSFTFQAWRTMPLAADQFIRLAADRGIQEALWREGSYMHGRDVGLVEQANDDRFEIGVVSDDGVVVVVHRVVAAICPQDARTCA